MFCKNGTLKLMDLGVAKAESGSMEGEITLTVEQTSIGTPSYASPEQCECAHNVDTRSDIYCLGATLYHAASGHVPFGGGWCANLLKDYGYVQRTRNLFDTF